MLVFCLSADPERRLEPCSRSFMYFLPLHTCRRCVALPVKLSDQMFLHLGQYLWVTFAQLTLRLRDSEVSLRAQETKLYHLGIGVLQSFRRE
jgi:hypothetical protein